MSTNRNAPRRPTLLAALVVLLIPASLIGAEQAPAGAEPGDPWAPLRLLAWTWQGEIDGKLGKASGIRRYQFILDGNFLLREHASVRPPQEKSPRGDHHRDLAVYSLDRERGKIVLRHFLVEGFVNQYVCETAAEKVMCETEKVENGSGWRARFTVTLNDRFAFEEIYELAPPGRELEVFFTNRWTRTPALED